MLKKIPKWSEKETRRAHLEERINRVKTAYFGFQKIPASEKTEHVRFHFDRVARRYDLMNSILSLGIHHLWKRKAMRLLNLGAGDRVIDICGGTADLSILASTAVGETGKIVVYDINQAMLQVGVQKVSQISDRHRIQFVQGDAERISFPNAYFDGALVGFGIRNVTHLEKGFKEMYRVLKSGGKLMCLEFSKPTNPLFCRLYDLYSFFLMPVIGRIIVGSGKPYACLSETIRMFLLPEELSEVLVRIGFSRVSYLKLTNGIAAIHIGIKP